MTTLAYSYLRFSTPGQSEGNSYKRQIENTAKFAADHGWQLDDTLKLEDLGVSAFKAKNLESGALGEFVTLVKRGKIEPGSVLIIESLDRISRQTIGPALNLFTTILSAGIKIATVFDNQIYDESNLHMSIWMATSSLIRANEESAVKSKRLKAAWEFRREKSKEKPIDSHAPFWLKLSDDRSKFVVIPERVKILKRIFDEYVKGKGAYAIAATFNQEGVQPLKKSKIWYEGTIRKIICSREVLGEKQNRQWVNGKHVDLGEPIKDYYPAVIDEAQFNMAQSMRKNRRIAGGGRTGKNVTNVFQKVAVCGYCGSSMVINDKGCGHVYYTCINRKNGGVCTSKPWPFQKFEKAFFQFVAELDLKSIVQGALADDDRVSLEQSIESTKASKEQKSLQIRSYLIKIENDESLADFYQDRVRELAEDVKKLDATIEEMQTNLAELDNTPTPLSDADIEAMAAEFTKGDNRQQLAVRIKSIIRKIDVYGSGIDVRRVQGDSIIAKLQDIAVDLIHAFPDKGTNLGNPYFTVFFKNGDVRSVMPDNNNDEKSLYDERFSMNSSK